VAGLDGIRHELHVTLFDLDHHTLAIDISDLEENTFETRNPAT
jgi:hypothetical protein